MSSSVLREEGWERGLPATLGLQGVDIGEIAVGASEVDAVPHDELIRHLEAHVLDVEIYLSARGLGEERADLQGGWFAREQGSPQIGEGEPRVYDVLHYEDVAACYVLLEVLEDADHPARGSVCAV